jgi:hypothetical protein
MGRVINTNSAAKSRAHNRRTIAELLRHLGQKPRFDEEARDMAATLVLALAEIDAGIQQSAESWEKRDYWIKSERLLREWRWVAEAAANLDDVIRHEAWDLLPALLMELFPHFTDIEISKFTRKADSWAGNHARLLAREPLPSPF